MIEILKQCSKCGKEKPVEEFAWRNKAKGLRQYVCRTCHSIENRKHYLANRQQYLDRAQQNNKRYAKRAHQFIYRYLEAHPCVDCRETDVIVLEFDHVLDDGKNMTINRLKNYSIERIRQEMAKCEVRCANCHVRRHAREGGSYKVQMANKM